MTCYQAYFRIRDREQMAELATQFSRHYVEPVVLAAGNRGKPMVLSQYGSHKSGKTYFSDGIKKYKFGFKPKRPDPANPLFHHFDFGWYTYPCDQDWPYKAYYEGRTRKEWMMNSSEITPREELINFHIVSLEHTPVDLLYLSDVIGIIGNGGDFFHSKTYLLNVSAVLKELWAEEFLPHRTKIRAARITYKTALQMDNISSALQVDFNVAKKMPEDRLVSLSLVREDSVRTAAFAQFVHETRHLALN